jgi:hypothetical protein
VRIVVKPRRGIPLWRRLCSWLALAALMLAASGQAEGQGFCDCAGYSFRVGAVEPIDCYQVRVPVFIAGPSGADELNGLVVQGGLNAGSGAVLDGALPPCTDTQGKEAFIELREP